MAFQNVDIEQVRDYWNARPCNVRHSPAPVGTSEYFDQVEARKYLVEPHIPGFADFDRWAGKDVLEIGCGIGTDTMNFARAGASVTAVDLSDASLALARQRAEIYGLSNRINFVRADAEELSRYVAAKPYDLVYSFGVIHHSPHPERIVQEVRRHFTRSGTVLRVMVYNRFSWKVLAILAAEGHGAVWRLNELVARSSEAQSGCPVTFTYSRRSVCALLDGFDVADTFVDHVFPYRVADYVEYRYVKAWYARFVPPRLWRAFERALGWHLCVTATAP